MDLVRAQLADEHMITAPHTLAHWPQHLHVPGPTWDRSSRDNWAAAGNKDLWGRAVEEVETRLAAYQPVSTAPEIDANCVG